jgi:tyrosyl-tRNA synthetase
MPTEALSDDAFIDGKVDILTILVKAGLTPSRSEARRAVEQGGVTVDGDKVTDFKKTYTKDEIANGLVVRRGKKAFKKVTL